MTNGKTVVTYLTVMLALGFNLVVPDEGHAKKSVYDPTCDCYVPDTSTPDIAPPDTSSPDPRPEPVSPFVLTGTGKDSSTAKRDLSEPVFVTHRQPDGRNEQREFRFSTPKNWKKQANRSMNLWLILHGRAQDSSTLHEYFNEIPHEAPSLLVYPQSFHINEDNVIDPTGEMVTQWRVMRKPGSESTKDAFRDVVFIDWLTSQLLTHNPQLDPAHVYVSGFSSGGSLAWMLLCYRSKPFQAFAVYSMQLHSVRTTGGCGDAQLPDGNDTRTGYEKLTGQKPDRYGSLGFDRVDGPSHPVTRPVFYAHGTADDNLNFTGDLGCSDRGTCELQKDPQYSMDPEGPLEDRDDISTINWLTKRHRVSSEPSARLVILDGNPQTNHDEVTTRRYDYKYVLDSAAKVVAIHGEPIRWYEMNGAGHSLSALDRTGGDTVSKDYDVSVHTQQFFENEAGMLQKH